MEKVTSLSGERQRFDLLAPVVKTARAPRCTCSPPVLTAPPALWVSLARAEFAPLLTTDRFGPAS